MLSGVDLFRLNCTRPGCTATLAERSTAAETIARARAGGWHIWTGETVGGMQQTVVLCPEDARGRRLKPEPIEGEQTLF